MDYNFCELQANAKKKGKLTCLLWESTKTKIIFLIGPLSFCQEKNLETTSFKVLKSSGWNKNFLQTLE